ncbi:MAG: MAPEG family protein [Pseudomonadota bacterium]
MTAIQAVGLYAGLNILLIFILSIRVSLRRRGAKISLGDGGDDIMLRRVRAHANAVETIPAALVGLALMAAMSAPVLAIHAIGAGLTLGRVLHAMGLSANSGPSMGRVTGSSLTLLVYLALAIGLIGHALI